MDFFVPLHFEILQPSPFYCKDFPEIRKVIKKLEKTKYIKRKLKKSKSANHRHWHSVSKDFMKKQNKKKSHKMKEKLKAEKQKNISEKSRMKSNILDKNKNIEEIAENNNKTSTVMEFITGKNFFNILTFKLTTDLSNHKSRHFFYLTIRTSKFTCSEKQFLIIPYFLALLST